MPEWLEAVRELREGHAMLRLREVASPGGWCAERFTTLAGGTVACWQKQGHVGQHHSLSGRYVW